MVYLTHGHCPKNGETPTYISWRSMRGRCLHAHNASFNRYGQRGISFDPAWESFAVFLAEMGERPKGTSLDRIDTDKDYSRDNCRWATPKEQSNNRANTPFISACGVTKHLSQWSEELGVPRQTILGRIRRGWEINEAVSRPPRTWKRKDRGEETQIIT